MEFYKITKKYCLAIVPPLSVGVAGDNHYSILSDNMWKKLFQLVGFKIIKEKQNTEDCIENRYLLIKE